ncbi:MAG: rhomboid family intramembrane serine protease [Planctomycetota bacterium]
MFFPIRTDRRLKRTPWVNYTLIALNLGVYAFTWQSTQQYALDAQGGYSIEESFQNSPGVALWLWPDDPQDTHLRLYQFITYQFVHSGPEPAPFFGIMLPLHLIFNMLFLYVFGNAVEDRLGSVGYLGFYLAGGVLAGLAHMLTGGGPVLGASGSVAAVTGIYLALFPMSNVTMGYWLIVFFGSFVVSSMVLILFRVVLDVIFQFSGYGNTAYVAHLAGYLYGFVIGMGFLLTRLLPREQYDMLALIEDKRRRHRARREKYEADTTPITPPTATEEEIMSRRSEIQESVKRHDMAHAAELYARLLKDDPAQTLGPQTQLDLASEFGVSGAYDTAAQAYELYLKNYSGPDSRTEVSFILGLIYTNRLDRPERAHELLTSVRDALPPDEREVADNALKTLGGRLS